MTHARPVVIVGAGPAGLSTALHLQQRAPHLRIVVLERARFPRDKTCAGAIAARAFPVLERIGFDVSAIPNTRIDRFVVELGGRTVEASEPDCARVVRRLELDHALAKLAASRGIELREGTHVTGLARDRDGLRVEVRGGEPIAARVVIGADGIMGTMRRALGLQRATLHAQAVEVDTSRVSADEPTDTARFVFDPTLRGYRWDFPTPLSDTIMMSRGVYQLCDDDHAHDPQAHLRRHLHERGVPFIAPRQLAERGFVPHAPASAPGVLLVGEAAGIDFPTGEGIAQALLYGAIAAPYLADALDQGRLGFVDWPDAILAHPEGRFLARRHRVGKLLFGRARPLVERAIARAPSALHVLLRRFAGRPLSRREQLRAVLALTGWRT
ncbi:MAG: NAD(P)/FAD-dependent oxidoreductase [Polyangia bacterium]